MNSVHCRWEDEMERERISHLPYIYIYKWLCSGPVVSLLDHQPQGSGIKSRQGQKFDSRFLLHLRPLAKSAMMNTLTAHCQWEDKTVKERTCHPHSCAEAKKMKSLTLHTHGCPGASLRD